MTSGIARPATTNHYLEPKAAVKRTRRGQQKLGKRCSSFILFAYRYHRSCQDPVKKLFCVILAVLLNVNIAFYHTSRFEKKTICTNMHHVCKVMLINDYNSVQYFGQTNHNQRSKIVISLDNILAAYCRPQHVSVILYDFLQI